MVAVNVSAGAATAVPANGSAADDGGKYYVGFTNVTGSGAVETFNINANSLVDGYGDASHKFCWRFDTNTVIVDFESSAPFVPKKYYLRTADGAAGGYPDRNPKDWNIYGKLSATDEWTAIASVTNDTTMEAVNYQSYEFDFTNPSNKAFKYFRFEVTDVSGTDPRDGWEGRKLLELSELYMSGTPAPAAADDIPFTFNDSGNYQGVSEYRFGSFAERWNNITKIEVLIDMEKITGWGGQVFYAKGTAESDRHSAMFDSTPGIKKYTAGEGTIEGVDFAGIQLVGMGRLLAYTVTFSEGDPITAGDWNIPEVTPPDAKTGLTATSTAQTLVTAGTVTGTGTLEYSLDNSTWSTELPTGTDAGDYTVYYRVRYGTSYYVPLYNGISVTIGAAPVAKVGDTEYTDFSAALSNWSAGSPLTLLDDVTADSTITVTGTRAIDLNGHNINSSVQTAISVSSGAELTISGSGKISNLILNQGTLNFNDAEVSAITTQGGLTNINSGKISAPSSWTALNSNNNGQVNISGGTIYAKSWRCVHANNGTVNISGGIFQSSVAPLSTEGNGKIILSGGYFPENINSATYTLADGYALVDSDDTSKGAIMVCVPAPVAKIGETEYTDFNAALNAWTDGTTLTLLDDVTVSNELIVPSGTTKICLNGHKLTTGNHIKIDTGNTLEIYDEGGGSIDAQYRIGAMFWINGGKLTINGGTFNGNVSTAGIVDIAANAVFTLNSGKITGRSTGRYDASVIRFTGSNGTFTMTGGEISGTTTRGGVTYFEKTDVTINISGNAKITNNKLESGSTQNLYLPTGVKINIAGALDNDANISITMQSPGVFTNSSNTSYNDESKFVSDNESYMSFKNADGQLELAEPVPLTDSFIQAIEDQTYTGEAIEPALTVKNGDTVLTADTDYTAEYSGNINAGTATVTITGIGIYTGTAQATFTIVPAVSSEISGSTGSTSVTVSGLEEEARAILEAEAGNSVNSVNVSMQVENASESSAEGSGSITDLAPDKKLTFYEIRVEKTIDSVKTLMSDTSNVLEIAVPYAYTGKQGVTAYRYHGNNAVALTQSDSRADGTFRVDEANGMVYIYANKFSTYAIGYTPYYSISGSAALAGYTGNVQAKLTASNGSIAADLGEVSLSELNFSNMTKGTYTLTLTWTDGKENNIMIPITLD